MIEQGINCAKQHNEPILGILQDQSLKIEQRLLCLTCIKEFQSIPQLINFEEAKRIIQDNQDAIYENISMKIEKIVASIQEFDNNIQELRQTVNHQLQTILNNTQTWRQNLLELQKQNTTYFLLSELEKMNQPIEIQLNRQQNFIDQCNYSYFNKIQFSQKMEQIMKGLITSKQSLNDIFNISDNETVQIEKLNSKLYFNCPQHNSKIIFVDLLSQNFKCMYCGQGDAITITEFEKKWETFQKQKMLRDKKKKAQKIKESFRKQTILNQLMIEQQKGIQEIIDNLNQNLFQLNPTIEQSGQDHLLRIIQEMSQDDQQNSKQKANPQMLYQLQGLVNLFRQKIQTIYNKFEYELIDDSIQQLEVCAAIAFNYNGTKIATTCNEIINIWDFQNGKFKGEPIKLSGHSKKVFCLVYSKKQNFLVSGGMDYSLRLWKEMNDQWISSPSVEEHTNSVFCLIMNKAEDQLISGSMDHTIKIWKINYEQNQLIYEYSLEQHTDWVFSICLNESETTLASCSQDCSIMIWEYVEQKLQFQYLIPQSVNDFGFRLNFINDKTLAWQQRGLGFTYFYQLVEGKFIETQHKIQLNQAGNDVFALFPSVWNKQRQLLFQKHNQYVYIISLHNGRFQLQCEPIDCNSLRSYGGLTNDGQYLVIWNDATNQFKVYQFNYELQI